MSTTVSLQDVKALKVRVNVTARQDFTGVHCAGVWWPEGVSEAVITSDEGATGQPVTDPNSGAVLDKYTLEMKVNQFYSLEGRRRVYGKWSEPGFELPDHSDSTNKKPAPKAPRVLRLDILDRQFNDGSWESEKKAPATEAALPPGKPKPQAAARP